MFDQASERRVEWGKVSLVRQRGSGVSAPGSAVRSVNAGGHGAPRMRPSANRACAAHHRPSAHEGGRGSGSAWRQRAGTEGGMLSPVLVETGVPALAILIGYGTTLIERFAFGLDAGSEREF